MSNSATEAAAIRHVLDLERQAGRSPEDVSRKGAPYDVSSPPRKIEIKAFGGSARGAGVPLEGSQVDAALEDPQNYYVYVVDNVDSPEAMGVLVLHGELLRAMIDRSTPRRTYWPTFRTGDYDTAERLL